MYFPITHILFKGNLTFFSLSKISPFMCFFQAFPLNFYMQNTTIKRVLETSFFLLFALKPNSTLSNIRISKDQNLHSFKKLFKEDDFIRHARRVWNVYKSDCSIFFSWWNLLDEKLLKCWYIIFVSSWIIKGLLWPGL